MPGCGERLFQVMALLAEAPTAAPLWRAVDLAARLGVSERTVHRDLAVLARRGVPVQGEAGVGYRLTP